LLIKSRFGGLPALFALYYRITIPETPRYTFDVAKDIEQAGADITAYMNNKSEGHPDEILRHKTKLMDAPALTQPKASWADFYNYFSKWRNGSVLLGTTTSWFFLDLAFYGLGLNNSIILEAIGYSAGPNVYVSLYNTAVGNIILVCAGSLPGYWLSVFTIDWIGRKPIQIGGFAILTLLLCVIGFAYHKLSENALLALYVLAQFFFNFGPNTTTFIIPGECFPTRYRSTAHGLSAAMGKIGAIIAQVIAQPLLSKDSPQGCSGNKCSPWLPHLMEIFALFMFCGTLVSFLVPETKLFTLEQLAGEDGPRPQHPTNSSTGSPNWLSPVLGPLSPKLRAEKRKSSQATAIASNGGMFSLPDSAMSSGGRSEMGENYSGGSHGGYSSDGDILVMAGHGSAIGRGHDRDESTSSRGHTRMESIPLQDVGGLISKSRHFI
jgi:PHS family inorganic phosphate transporter-like MFS transporter